MNRKNNLILGKENGPMPARGGACLLNKIAHSFDSLFDHVAVHTRAETIVMGRPGMLSYAYLLFPVLTPTSLQNPKDGLAGVTQLEGHSLFLFSIGLF